MKVYVYDSEKQKTVIMSIDNEELIDSELELP